MSGPERRPYDSSGRLEAAERRRSEVLSVAARRFCADGWHRTTVASVAAEAGVSVDFIGQRIGSKADLLLHALRATAFTQVPDLRGAVEALDLGGPATDLVERTRRFSVFAATTLEPIAPFHDVLRQAADADPQASAMLDGIEQQRRSSTVVAVRKILLTDPGPELTDEVFVLTSTAVYRELTVRCGWTTEQVQRWFARVIQEAATRARA